MKTPPIAQRSVSGEVPVKLLVAGTVATIGIALAVWLNMSPVPKTETTTDATVGTPLPKQIPKVERPMVPTPKSRSENPDASVVDKSTESSKTKPRKLTPAEIPEGAEASLLEKALAENPKITWQEFLENPAEQAWAKRDPGGMMEWLGRTSVPVTGGGGPAGLKVAIYEWSRKDINAMAEWFKKNQNYPHYDHGIRYLVEFMAPINYSVAQSWLGTIKDPAIKYKAEEKLFSLRPKPPSARPN